MKKYLDKSRGSGISHYSIDENSVDVLFKNNHSVYRYSTPPINRVHIENMKELAEQGEGLNTYINDHREIKENYQLVK
jgi:hypothetical protein